MSDQKSFKDRLNTIQAKTASQDPLAHYEVDFPPGEPEAPLSFDAAGGARAAPAGQRLLVTLAVVGLVVAGGAVYLRDVMGIGAPTEEEAAAAADVLPEGEPQKPFRPKVGFQMGG